MFANVVVNNVATATATAISSTNDRYVRRDSIYSAVMSAVAYALLLFMLINTSSMLKIYMIGVAFIMVYIMELIMKLSNFPTIQKPNCRQFPELTMASLADALRLDKFTGVHFKRW